MFKRNKLWVSISAATLVGATSLTGCSPEPEVKDEDEPTTSQHAPDTEAATKPAVALGGEGEGEGEGASKADPSTNDLAYLTHLALIRGHLFVGHKLYQEDQREAAKTHMKHPKTELYANIASAFEARKTSGFAAELETFATRIEQNQEKEAVASAYETLTTAISENAKAVASEANAPAKQLKLVAALLRTAGNEYAIAVVDGKVQNAHEYQVAYGFITTAKSIIDGFDDGLAAKSDANELLDSLSPLWPSIVPPESLSTEAGQIYGAAARVELLALSL